MINLARIFGLLWVSQIVYANVIYGVEQVNGHYRQIHYPVYIQMGSFSTIHAAKKLQHTIDINSKVPSKVQLSKGRYNVSVGPFKNQYSLNTFANTMRGVNAKNSPPQFKKSSDAKLSQTTASNSTVKKTILKPAQLPLKKSILGDVMQQKFHPEFSVFLGDSYIPNTINGQSLQLLPYETGIDADTFINQGDANAFTWGVEGMYRFKLPSSIQNYFLNSIGAGIDFFQITNFNQNGSVLQFGLPEFENYTYTLKLNNIRIMGNFDLDFQSLGHYFTPFLQGGIGGARTAISYISEPISPVISPTFTLANQASWNFAYQAGGGVKYSVKAPLVLSLRYLYSNMGKANSSTLGSSTTLATPLTATMSTHNFLFGLTYLVE